MFNTEKQNSSASVIFEDDMIKIETNYMIVEYCCRIFPIQNPTTMQTNRCMYNVQVYFVLFHIAHIYR